ncbi:MAG: hypothetical protein DSZ23_01910 [Thermodesulfatator sp.]|nr:MAG: hypothetical protein DSZ23_01910 [Thermodesulfatator sp.]
MAEIKSAFEIAMERAEKIGSLSREEIEQQKWEEKGKKTAAAYLSGKIDSLQDGLKDVPAQYIQTALSGVSDVLLRNIVLPRDPHQWDGIRRAMQGLTEIKGSIASQVMPQIEQLLKNYESTMSHYKEQFKQQVSQAMGGRDMNAMAMDSEGLNALASMQDEWNKMSAEISQQFEQQLEPMKAYLK